MKRSLLSRGAVLAVAVVALAGCSSDGTESYCDALSDQQDRLHALADGAGDPGTDVFGESLEIFEDLRAQAPSDVEDEWDTLVFAWQGLADAFERAGTTPQEYDPQNPPAGIDEADAKALEDAAADLASPRVTDAGDGIEQHALDVCKVDLGLRDR